MSETSHKSADSMCLNVIIAVSENSSHESAISDAVEAFCKYYRECLDSPELMVAFKGWSTPEKRKTVRRTKASQLDKVQDFVVARHGSASIVPPQLMSQTPKEVRRLQVSGLDLPQWGEFRDVLVGSPVVTAHIDVNTELGLSTGKTIAQVLHAVHEFLLTTDESVIRSGFRVRIGANFNSQAEVVIVDNGYTEIPANTATVSTWIE